MSGSNITCDGSDMTEWNTRICEFILSDFSTFVYVSFPLVSVLLLLLLIMTICLIGCCYKQWKRKKRMYVVDEDKDGGNEIPLNEIRTDGGDKPADQVAEAQYDVPIETRKKAKEGDGMYDVVPDDPGHVHQMQRLATLSSLSQSGTHPANLVPLQMPNVQVANLHYIPNVTGTHAEMQPLPPPLPFEHQSSIRGRPVQHVTYGNFPIVLGTQAELQQLQSPALFENRGSVRRQPPAQVYAVVDKSKKNRRPEEVDFLINSPDDPPPSPPPPPPPPPLPASYEQVSLKERDPPKQSSKPVSPVPGRQYHHLEHSNYPQPTPPQVNPGLYDQIDDQKAKFHGSFSRSEELLSSSYLAKRYAQPTTNRTLTLAHASLEGEGGTHGVFADPPPPPPLPRIDLESYHSQQITEWGSVPKQSYATDL